LRLEIAVQHSQVVGFGQTFTNLLGRRNRFRFSQVPRPLDETLQILSRDILHSNEERRAFLAKIIHAANVAVGYFAGKSQLVAETLDGFFIGSDLGLEKFHGHCFFDLPIEDFVDPSHAALTQFFNDFISPRKSAPPLELMERRQQSFRLENEAFAGGSKRPAAFPAEIGFLRVVKLTSGALHVFGGLSAFEKRISGLDSSVKPAVSRAVMLKTRIVTNTAVLRRIWWQIGAVLVYIQRSR
jgi:hypothetical protein